MARPIAATVFQKGEHDTAQPVRGYPYEITAPTGLIEVPDVTGGYNTMATRDQTPANSGRYVANARIRDYWCGRRPGTDEVGTAPDGYPVLNVVSFQAESGKVYIIRITGRTANLLHVDPALAIGGGAVYPPGYDPQSMVWEPLEILDANGNTTEFWSVLATVKMSPRLHYSFARFFDHLYMTDTYKGLWKFDLIDRTVRLISGSPRPKYITTFAERIFCGNMRFPVGGERPATVMWSANADPEDWESETSGFEDLGMQDVGDRITGVFGFQDVCVILRERSIWHATRVPLGYAPFRFREVVRGVGCDIPHSAVSVPGGVIFASFANREVYYYSPGSPPTPMARGVKRDMWYYPVVTPGKPVESYKFRDPPFAQATYDPTENEYHLALTNSRTQPLKWVWVLSLSNGAWTLDTGPEISCLGALLPPGGGVIIDDLVGTIDAQPGIIDDLSGPEAELGRYMYKGIWDGKVIRQSYNYATDYDDSWFSFIFRSPNIGSVSKRRSVQDLGVGVEYGNSVGGGSNRPWSISVSRDEKTWTWSRSGVINNKVEGQKGTLRFPKTRVTGNDLFWQLSCQVQGIRLVSWYARLLEKGLKRS